MSSNFAIFEKSSQAKDVRAATIDDQHRQDAAREARDHQLRITCGPAGPVATRWRPRTAVNTSSLAFRPAAS
jgi:hypothetical protein